MNAPKVIPAIREPMIGPDEWEAFFRMVGTLFPPAFCAGATALLLSYDDDCESAA